VTLDGRRVPVTRLRACTPANGSAHTVADWIVFMEDGSGAAKRCPEAILSSMAEPRVQHFLNRVGIR
jgi:ABC-type polar amino acid transport system ATPase subunit